MIQLIGNAMITLMMVKFIINDLPHAAGFNMNATLSPVQDREYLAKLRLQQLKKYLHTYNDLMRIVNRQGTVKLYHGCPTEFAEMLVREGPRVPYRVEDTARYVAKVYGLSWYEFRPYAYRAREVVQKLSTSTATIAARWAWTFPLGEVLTDLNAHARLLVASKSRAKLRGISVEDAYEELDEEAMAIARQHEDIQYSTNAAPDILGLPDKLALKAKTGALVELVVDTRAIPDYVIHSINFELRNIEKGEWTKEELVTYWNYSYRDIKIAPSGIKSARIVIRDMQPWEQDMVEDLIKEELSHLEEREGGKHV